MCCVLASTSIGTAESVGFVLLLMGCALVNSSMLASISVGSSVVSSVGSCVGKIAGELVGKGTYELEISARRFSIAVSSSGGDGFAPSMTVASC